MGLSVRFSRTEVVLSLNSLKGAVSVGLLVSDRSGFVDEEPEECNLR